MHRTALDRVVLSVPVEGGQVRIKVGSRHGTIDVVTPEFDDAAALAQRRGLPVRHVLDEAAAAAASRGLRRGARWPADQDPQQGAAI